jgi:hypothetical protein
MAKKTSIVFGIIFLIAGVWGLISTSVLGLFVFGSVASIIHIIVAIVLFAVASKPGAIGALKTVGIIYVIFFILTLLGAAFLGDSASGWLYLILGLVMAILGFSGKKGGSVSTPTSTPTSAPQM